MQGVSNVRSATGALVWSGKSEINGEPIIVIATAIKKKKPGGSNQKTGDVVQTWILPAKVRPFDALMSGADASVCGDCALRGAGGKGRVCYPHIGMVDTVYQAHARGLYPPIATFGPRAFAGRVVRLGSYGDPAAAPFAVWSEVLASGGAGHWVGYTHQWRTCDPRFRLLCMASVETEAQRDEAWEMGWRTFRVMLPTEGAERGEIVCPASAEAGHRTTCEQCRLCDGRRVDREEKRKSIAIAVHGWNPARSNYVRTREEIDRA